MLRGDAMAAEAARKEEPPMVEDDDMIRRGDVLAILDDEAWLDDTVRRVRALPAVTPRPMKDAPRDGTKVLAWWPAQPGRRKAAWVTSEVNEDTFCRSARGDFSYLGAENAPTQFLPHPPEGGSDAPRDRGKMVKPKPGDLCGGYATEGGGDA
jgi:hypothetical protein